MANDGGWDEDGGAWWEINYQPEIPQDDLTSSKEVKLSEGGDRAPSEGEVAGIGVGKCDGPWAEVKCGGRPGASSEVAPEVGVGIVELSKLDDIVRVEPWGEDVEGGCRGGYFSD